MKFNNPMIRHKFTADPTVLEHNGKIYLFTGHDEPPEGVEDYVMNDWLCFSSEDLISWKEYPSPLKAKNFSWASGDAFASKVIQRNHKFFLYVAVTHQSIPGKAIGVAVADQPEGPYRDAKGSALIAGDMLPRPAEDKSNLDPTVLIDDDGQAYLFWGNGICYYVKLKENMVETDGEIRTVDLPGFSEGAHIYKRGHLYYLMYGSGFPEKVAYAMTEDINGSWIYKGVVNEVPENCETNRPATIDFKGRSYFFYHNGNLPGGGSHRRSVCADFLYYNQDHSIKPVIMT
jgi:hypothetical protein